jgi:hypothetical protein
MFEVSGSCPRTPAPPAPPRRGAWCRRTITSLPADAERQRRRRRSAAVHRHAGAALVGGEPADAVRTALICHRAGHHGSYRPRPARASHASSVSAPIADLQASLPIAPSPRNPPRRVIIARAAAALSPLSEWPRLKNFPQRLRRRHALAPAGSRHRAWERCCRDLLGESRDSPEANDRHHRAPAPACGQQQFGGACGSAISPGFTGLQPRAPMPPFRPPATRTGPRARRWSGGFRAGRSRRHPRVAQTHQPDCATAALTSLPPRRSTSA